MIMRRLIDRADDTALKLDAVEREVFNRHKNDITIIEKWNEQTQCREYETHGLLNFEYLTRNGVADILRYIGDRDNAI